MQFNNCSIMDEEDMLDILSGDYTVKASDARRIISSLSSKLENYRISAAKYKAMFYGKHDLAKKLEMQERENRDARIGEWDGFCYASWRAEAKFRTLEDMLKDGFLNEKEYEICNIREGY